MGEPHLHPFRNILTATTVAGVMLVAIAGCAGQPLNAKESDALAGGFAGSGGGASAGVVVVTAFVEPREPQGSDQPLQTPWRQPSATLSGILAPQLYEEDVRRRVSTHGPELALLRRLGCRAVFLDAPAKPPSGQTTIWSARLRRC